jgi:trk system potassium uptake protein TrkH
MIKKAEDDVPKVVHPRTVQRVSIKGKSVSAQATTEIYTFFALYIMLLFFCTLVVSLDGYDYTTNFTAALSCISNIGPGLSLVGPTGNFAIFSTLSKLTLTVTMLLGRLEIYAVLILFIPSTWQKR